MTSETVHDAITFRTQRLGDDPHDEAVADLLLTAYRHSDHVDELLAHLRHAASEIDAAIRSIEQVA
jgi:hypothetical protein